MALISSVNGRWVLASRRNTSARLRLFCFPHAGGSASSFAAWSRFLPGTIDVLAVELPGHGGRFGEALQNCLTTVAEAASAGLVPYIDRPFAIWGHSMGALVGFEVARHLCRRGLDPTHLLVSAHRAPRLDRDRPAVHTLGDEEFVAYLRLREGMSRAVLADQELIRMMLPVLRADFRACETYRYRPDAPLSCPISAFGGRQDDAVPVGALEDWKQETRGGFTLQLFPGGHFYHQTCHRLLLREVADRLDQART
jgi:medium-chain acyl-[acyl-carrier-protein] hydrolase